MSYKFNRSKYDPDKASKPKASLPDAGSVVGVRLIGEGEVDFPWAGTKETKSRAGRPMLQIHCEVLEQFRGAGCWMLDYVMLDNEWTDQRVGAVLDATGHDMTAKGYVLDAAKLAGKVAYVRVKHEEYEGETRAKVAYWIVQDQYDSIGLDPLGEAKAPTRPQKSGGGVERGDDDEVPF